jgi:hypothetical protein
MLIEFAPSFIQRKEEYEIVHPFSQDPEYKSKLLGACD